MQNFKDIKGLNVFLHKVDKLFPIPLSEKQNLNDFALKLAEKATLFVEYEDDRIIAAVAGYTENVIDNLGYISIVATLPEAQGKGLASKLVNQFLKNAEQKQLNAVHLYAVTTNVPAIRMYQKLGFVEYVIHDEPRPYDTHLIYYINKEK